MKAKIVNIEIDGETKSFKLGNNEMCEIEEITGQSIMQIFVEIGSGMIKFSVLRAILFVGLKHADRSLTLNKVGDMINFKDELQGYTKAITECITTSFSGIPKSSESLGEDTEKK